MGKRLAEQVPGPYEDTTCQMVVAYGNPEHRHLEKIREFRDQVMKNSTLGRKIVDLYYATTPYAVPAAARNRFFRLLTLYGLAYPSYMVSRLYLDLL